MSVYVPLFIVDFCFSEIDSDGDEIPDDDDDESRRYYGYRIWYSLEIQVQPSPPERIMTVECACHVSPSSNVKISEY